MKDVGELTKQYSNLPERYIKRTAEQVEWTTPNLPNYLPRQIKRKRYRFGTHRPWTDEFKKKNEGIVQDFVHVEPIRNWLVFRGDRVEVLVGRDAGKQGIVSQVFQERNWVIVQGLNWCYRRIGVNKEKGFPGMVVRWELPLLVTNQVSLVDPSDNKVTKVEWRYTEEGERVRVSLRTGRIIPMPTMAEETYDYKDPKAYLENAEKDTKAPDVEEITFAPKLKTFEMDVMDAMGMKETRVPKKSYWY